MARRNTPGAVCHLSSKAEFKQVLQLWARISELTLFGCTDGARYRAAPHDSHDMHDLALTPAIDTCQIVQ